MINAAIVKNGIVENVIILNSLDEYVGAVECPEWIGIGMDINTPKPIETPTTVSMRQARLALLQSNLLSNVNTAIASGSEADKIAWEYATEVNRTDALVVNMATTLNLTEQNLDNLFTLANTL